MWDQVVASGRGRAYCEVMKYAVLGSLVVCARVASADASPHVPEEKSAGVALGLSLGATTAGVAMGALAFAIDDDSAQAMLIGGATIGVLVGPSLGHYYAHEKWSVGAVIRFVSGGVVAAGAVAIVVGATDEVVEGDGDSKLSVGNVLLVGGLVGIGVGAVVDIVTAPRAAHRYNESLASNISISPTVLRSADGPAMGFAVGGRF